MCLRNMTKERLEKHLAGHRPTTYMSLETQHKSVKVDEYKLLNNQIDRLAEAMHRLNKDLMLDRISKIDLISFIFMGG